MNKPASCMSRNGVKNNFLLFGIGLGILYWIIESIIHLVVFQKDTLIEQIFTSNVYDIGLRLLVLGIFLLLSAYAQFMFNRYKQAEKDLVAEKERLFSILDNLPASVHIKAQDHSIRFANRIFRECFGAPEGKKCYEVLHKRKDPCKECPPFRAFETKSPQEFNIVNHHNGRIYEVYDYPLVDDNDSPLLLELSLDITERKHAEEELTEYRCHLEQIVQERTEKLTAANRQLQAEIVERKRTEEALERSTRQNKLILEAVGEGIYGVDLLGNTTFVNSSAVKITGYEAVELIGRHQHEILHHSKPDASHYPQEECPIYASMKDGLTRHTTDEVFWRKDGISFPVEYVSTPIQERGVIVGAVVNFKDITERKRMDEELRKSQAQLLQSQKMEAIGILAGGIAHDFNNLLTTIQGYTSMVMMKLDSSGRLFRDLNQVHLAADRAAGLTHQLLLFSRKQPTLPVSLNLNRTIDNLLKMLQRLIGEDITVSTDMEPSLWPIQADESSIDQVIMNLVVNARDAMPKGGNIAMKTESVTVDEKQASIISEGRPGQFVCLSITDTGVGMDKEIIDRIFDPFFTTKGLGKGTGLGLSVVYGIVKQHEGWINIYSEPGQGSVFKIYLPASSYKSKNKVVETNPVHTIQGKGERILLVEDEEGVRNLTTRALRENGYIVVEAASTQEALDTFEQEKGNFHLVLSDVVLPDQTGLELVDQILRRQPKIHILLVSGYTDQKSEWVTIRQKGFRFVPKPYTLPDLLRSVRELIET